MDVGGALIRAFVHASQSVGRGDRVHLAMSASDCRLLPPEAAFVEREEAGGGPSRIAAGTPPAVA